MTVHDAYIRLIDFFRQHDSLSMAEDLKDVDLGGENQERNRQVVEIALERLVRMEVVVRGSGEDAWFLLKPLAACPQSVVISGETAGTIARIVNEAGHAMSDEGNRADPLNITEVDILKLCLIVENAFEQAQVQQASMVEQQKRVPLGFAA